METRKNLRTKWWHAAILAFAFCGIASANSVLAISNSNGTPDPVFGIQAQAYGGNSNPGLSMAGLLNVTVFFDNGLSSSGLWSSTGTCTAASTCGQATGTIGNGVWTLTETGATGPDTASAQPWTLTNTSNNVAIASVVLNGVFDSNRGVLFNRNTLNGVPQPSGGTPGDGGGLDFTFVSAAGGNSPAYDVTVQYTNIATLLNAGHVPCQNGWSANFQDTGCQDLFGTVIFTFQNANFIAKSNGTTNFVFFQDTDLILGAPEPGSFVLMGLGLTGFVLAYRRRRAATRH